MIQASSGSVDLPLRLREPPGFQWGFSQTADGAQLRWGALVPATVRYDCLLVGGFAEFIEKYFETFCDLSRRGLAVRSFDWRGQGGSTRPVDQPTVPRRRDFDRDANDLIAFARRFLAPGRRAILVAHSMGGAIALLALARAPELFAAAVLSAPMLGLWTAPVPRPIAHVLASLGVAWGRAPDFVPGHGAWTHDPLLSQATSLTSHDSIRCRLQQYWFTARPDLRLDGPTYGWLDSALTLTERLRDPGFLASIRIPVLIGCAGEEHFVDPRAEDHAVALLPKGTMARFPNARHELFLEDDDIRGRWFAAIDQFLTLAMG